MIKKPLVPYSDSEEESTDATEAISIGEPSQFPNSEEDFKDDAAAPEALDHNHDQEGCPSPRDFMSSKVDVAKEGKNLPSKSDSELETESEKEQPTKRKKKQSNSDVDESESASKQKRRRRRRQTKTALSYQGESDDSDVPKAASSTEPKNIRITLKDKKSAVRILLPSFIIYHFAVLTLH